MTMTIINEILEAIKTLQEEAHSTVDEDRAIYLAEEIAELCEMAAVYE